MSIIMDNEEELIDAVVRVRRVGDSAAQVFMALESSFSGLTVGMVKKACSKATKRGFEPMPAEKPDARSDEREALHPTSKALEAHLAGRSGVDSRDVLPQHLLDLHGFPAVPAVAALRTSNPVALTHFDAVALTAGSSPVLAVYGSDESTRARQEADRVQKMLRLDTDFFSDRKYHTCLGNTVDAAPFIQYVKERGGGNRTRLIRSCTNTTCSVLFVTHGKSQKACDTAANAMGLLHCGECGEAAYCCRRCQKEHWPLHKLPCATGRDARDFSKLLEKDEGMNLLISATSLEMTRSLGEPTLCMIRFDSPAALKRGLSPPSWLGDSRRLSRGERQDFPAKISHVARNALEALLEQNEDGTYDGNLTTALVLLRRPDPLKTVVVMLEVASDDGRTDYVGNSRVFPMMILPQNRGVADTSRLGFITPAKSGWDGLSATESERMTALLQSAPKVSRAVRNQVSAIASSTDCTRADTASPNVD